MATHAELRRLLDLLAGFPTTEAADRQHLQVVAPVPLPGKHNTSVLHGPARVCCSLILCTGGHCGSRRHCLTGSRTAHCSRPRTCTIQEHPELSWRQKMLLEFRAERKVLADNIQCTAYLLSTQQYDQSVVS